MRKNIFDNSQIWNWVDSNSHNTDRFEFTENLTPEDVTSLIDIGCGHGGFLKLISSRRGNIRYVGVDNSDGALEYIPFEKAKASITDVPYGDKEFDCVYALEVLEHLGPEDFNKARMEMSRLSKKYIIVSVPYNEDIQWNMVKCPSCQTIFHYDGHVQVFDEDKMEGLFKEHGFQCVSKERLGWSESFKFHKTYVSLFYPEQRFKAPHYTVCPVCNLELNPGDPGSRAAVAPPAVNNRKSVVSMLKNSVKALWPKEKKSYWIIALYKKR